MKDLNTLIDHPYRGVSRHIPMPRANRAAQFSPFAALTGYDDVIMEESRVTEGRRYIAEGLSEELDKTVSGNIGRAVEITRFVPDRKKSGGEYVTVKGIIKRIIPEEGVLVLQGGDTISLSSIMNVRALQEL